MVIAVIIAIIVAWFLVASHLSKKRRAELLAKYGNPEVVDRIMRHMFWQGQTEEQLRDSLGRPVDIGQKVSKTKTTVIWKYNRTGKNRFALRVTLENGVVVGWEQK